MDDILKFPKPAAPAAPAAERGVTETTVRRCIESINQGNLDLKSCCEKGGSWAVAAQRVQAHRRRHTMRSMAQNLLSRMAPEYRDGPPSILHELAGYEPPSYLSITQDGEVDVDNQQGESDDSV